MKMKKYLKKKDWNIKNSWFNWKHVITLKNMVEEKISKEFRWNKKLFSWRNRAKWIDE